MVSCTSRLLVTWEVQEVSQVLFMDGMTTWHGAAPPRMESFRGGLLEIKLLIPLMVPSMEKIYKNLDYGAAYGQNPLIPGCKELSSATKFAIQRVDIFAPSVTNGQRRNIVRKMQMAHGVPFRALELINSAYTDVGDQLAAHNSKMNILAEKFLRDHQPDTTWPWTEVVNRSTRMAPVLTETSRFWLLWWSLWSCILACLLLQSMDTQATICQHARSWPQSAVKFNATA